MDELTPRDPERGRRLFNVTPEERADPAFGSWKRMIIKAEDYSALEERSRIRDAYTIDPNWTEFKNFRKDMGAKPPRTWLDRKDRFKPFSKRNCRWATREQLNRLHDETEFFEYEPEEKKMRKTKTQWARILGVPIGQIRYKANNGTLGEFIRERMEME